MRHLSVFVALTFAAIVGACGANLAEEPLAGIVRSPEPSLADLSLPDRTGKDFMMRAESGRLLVVYFGYTACPDVCPTTMADLSAALQNLGDGADRIDVAVISIDPGRDTQEIIDGYAASFVEEATGLRTEDQDLLRSVTEGFGADYLVKVAEDGTIEVGHTGFLYAVDDNGNLVVSWSFGTPALDIERDLSILLARIDKS